MPTAAPVSASVAVAGTLTTTRCLPASAAATLSVKAPLASLLPSRLAAVARAVVVQVVARSSALQCPVDGLPVMVTSLGGGGGGGGLSDPRRRTPPE